EEEDPEEEEEDPVEDPEEDDDDVMEMDNEAEVINPYMDDGSNNPPPPNSEHEETPPTSPIIPDADGQPTPPIASFGQNFHFDVGTGHEFDLYVRLIKDITEILKFKTSRDRYENNGMSDLTRVSVCLGEISLEGNKSWESNIGDSDNIGDGDKMAGRAITTWGGGMEDHRSDIG
nr:hypothetical protein [Tanacetum cinerariifolium]